MIHKAPCIGEIPFNVSKRGRDEVHKLKNIILLRGDIKNHHHDENKGSKEF